MKQSSRGSESRSAEAESEAGTAGRGSRASRAASAGAVLAALPRVRVLVLGDLMLDEYRIGEVDRVSPEAPVPVVQVAERREALGGAGNVARGVLSLGAACRLVALVGEDEEGDRAVALAGAAGLRAEDLVRVPDRPTTHKLRVVGRGQQMLRLDREETSPLSPRAAEQIRARAEAALEEADVLILQDYAKGLLSPELSQWAIRSAQARGVRVVVDPKRDLERFRGADLVKPNLEEALALAPGPTLRFEDRRARLEKIQRALGGSAIVMTRGPAGVTCLGRDGTAMDLPTRAVEVFDVQGAGDTSAALLGLALGAGASLPEACIVAMAAASVVVGKQGTATVSMAELQQEMPNALAAAEGPGEMT